MQDVEIELPSNRSFGILFALIFCGLAIFFRNDLDRLWLAALYFLGAMFAVLSVVSPAALLPANRLWMAFGRALGSIVSPIVLGSIFFGIFLPCGLFLRIIGRDELLLKIRAKDTHWRLREPSEQHNQSFKQQF